MPVKPTSIPNFTTSRARSFMGCPLCVMQSTTRLGSRNEGHRPGLGDFVVLVGRSAADPDRTDDLAVCLQGDAPGKDNDPAPVRLRDTEQRLLGLAHGRQLLGRDVEGAGGPRLVLCDLNAAQPGAVHAG